MRCTCGMPVEVEARYVMDAYTDEGVVPLEHVKGLCAIGHRFNCQASYLAEEPVLLPSRPGSPHEVMHGDTG